MFERAVFSIFAALAEFERELVSERTKVGLASARARGRKGGGQYKMTSAKLRLAMAAMGQRQTVVNELGRELGVTRQTLYGHFGPDGSLREDGEKGAGATTFTTIYTRWINSAVKGLHPL